MGLREFTARENIYELARAGRCGGGFTRAYIAKEAKLFGLAMPEEGKIYGQETGGNRASL